MKCSNCNDVEDYVRVRREKYHDIYECPLCSYRKTVKIARPLKKKKKGKMKKGGYVNKIVKEFNMKPMVLGRHIPITNELASDNSLGGEFIPKSIFRKALSAIFNNSFSLLNKGVSMNKFSELLEKALEDDKLFSSTNMKEINLIKKHSIKIAEKIQEDKLIEEMRTDFAKARELAKKFEAEELKQRKIKDEEDDDDFDEE